MERSFFSKSTGSSAASVHFGPTIRKIDILDSLCRISSSDALVVETSWTPYIAKPLTLE